MSIPPEPPESCRLCGLPVRGRKDGFCCLGCSHVFEILKEMLGIPDPEAMRAHPFFQQMQAQGIIPSEEGDLARMGMDPEGTSSIPPGEASDEQVLKVTGMWCPSCSWVIERSLMKKTGIVRATASFASDRVKVAYLPRLVGPADLVEVIRDLGYGVEETEAEQDRERALRMELIRLGVGVFLTVNIMMISFGLYQGFLTELSDAGIRMMGVPIFLMSTVVVFYCGYPVLERALKAARACGFVMETLISLGAVSAYGLSVYQLFRGSLHMYFDTASMLVTLILLGKYLEARIRHRATLGVEEIYDLLPGKVRVETGGGERYASIEAVASGDVVRALEEEQIPVDGVVLSGEGRVDESRLTGESGLRTKGAGDTVLGASLLVSGELRIRITGVGSSSAIGRMIGLMEEALVQKNPTERLTDRIMAVFGPVVILLALTTGVVLSALGSPLEAAFVRAITILVIACPCALGIAIPLARVAAIGRARREGILVVNGDALEAACRLTALVIDKTGTATRGTYQMIFVEDTGGAEAPDVLGLAAAMEAGSDHPVARTIRRHAASVGAEAKGEVQAVELGGLGMKGSYEGVDVLVGNEALLASEGVDLDLSWREAAAKGANRGETVVFIAQAGVVCGMMRLGDALRSDMPDAVAELKAMGVEVHLISGDTESATAHVAGLLGVDRFRGGVLPEEKVEWVSDLQRKGHRVGMVGDGANDAAALAVADVGFATGDALTVTKHASDVTILSFSGARILSVMELSELASKTVVTNLFLALAYNLVALPVALAGLVNPVIAVTAMLLSSLTVVCNSARIASFTGERRKAKGEMDG
jgi:Cu2+-exporting ATPase/Cu+-exporting ATPase